MMNSIDDSCMRCLLMDEYGHINAYAAVHVVAKRFRNSWNIRNTIAFSKVSLYRSAGLTMRFRRPNTP